jgi:hypothetical protein
MVHIRTTIGTRTMVPYIYGSRFWDNVTFVRTRIQYHWYTCTSGIQYHGTRVPLETGGRVNKAARDWLDALTAPEQGEQVPSQNDHPWNPQMRTTTETVLREAMQALVRVQAHMLARIVVEIRAADVAVELEPQL